MDLVIIGILEMEIIQKKNIQNISIPRSGTYTVELKVYSKNNKSFESDFKTVIVKDLPCISCNNLNCSCPLFQNLNWLENSWDVGGLPDIRFQIVDGTTTYLDGCRGCSGCRF